MAELLRAHQLAGALEEAAPDLIEARLELDPNRTGLDEMIRAHLGKLDQTTRDVLAALAVWGIDVGADDLARLLPEAEDVGFRAYIDAHRGDTRAGLDFEKWSFL